jgi:hypothetical protein
MIMKLTGRSGTNRLPQRTQSGRAGDFALLHVTGRCLPHESRSVANRRAVDVLRVSYYSPWHPRGSHIMGNRFELGNLG